MQNLITVAYIFVAWIAVVVWASRPKSVSPAVGKARLAYAILAVIVFALWALVAYPAAGWSVAVIGVYVWIRSVEYRSKLRALKVSQNRLVKLK
jgi:hypothetical protein